MDPLDALTDASSATVADALDRLGHRYQTLDPAIRPLWPRARVVGRAVPVVVVADPSIPELPYDGEMSALESLGPGDVPVFAVEDGIRAASWGELFSCGAIGRGARGAIVDGFIRDAQQIEALGFPTFARGYSPLDTLGRAVVSSIGETASIGGVVVDPGDLIVGDVDGIVVIPSELTDEVVAAVASKRKLEQAARDDLIAGLGIRAVWDKYEVF